jgi:hypothetical protein
MARIAATATRPNVVVVSASSGPHSAYVAGRFDGRLYRRLSGDRWERVRDGWAGAADHNRAAALRRRKRRTVVGG